MSNYKIKFSTSDIVADPLSAIKLPFTVTEGTVNNTSTSLTLCGHNYPNYGQLLWTNMVHLLENFAGMAEPSGASTIGQLWYDSSEGKLKLYKGAGVGEGYQYITGDDSTLFNEENLNTMLKTFNPSQHATPYFDNRYIRLTGGTDIGTLELAWDSDLVVTGGGMVKVSAEPVNDEDVVNRSYLAKVFSMLGYDINDLNAITSLYLPLTGGTMTTDAVITVPKSIEILSNPTKQNHAITKGYAEDNFVSFGVNKKAIEEITMSGPLWLSADSCELADDSLQAVPAIWVTNQLSKLNLNIGSGLYIPITSTTGTTVTNNLTFTKNNWLKVDIDAANWSDQKLVLNQERANSLYVKRAGDTLTAHPFAFTQPTTQPTVPEEKLDALNVPTAGWVNHRIKDAVAAGGGGSTVTKLSVYGSPITMPASRTATPTTPDGTVTLSIPSNSITIDYEIRFGATRSKTSTSANMTPPTFVIDANGTQVYDTTGGLSAIAARDEIHSFKYTATANTVCTLTVKVYGGVLNVGPYTVSPWIIADPLSATVAIQATNAPPAGSVTAGPAGNVTYVDFGNGMVMISGVSQTTVKSSSSGLAGGNSTFVGTDITFPNNIKLKIPYMVTATHMMEPGLAKSGNFHNETMDTSAMITRLVTQSGCTVDWLIALVPTYYSAALKKYYATPRDVYWTVTGFKV
jgi:hypothetical protein